MLSAPFSEPRGDAGSPLGNGPPSSVSMGAYRIESGLQLHSAGLKTSLVIITQIPGGKPEHYAPETIVE